MKSFKTVYFAILFLLVGFFVGCSSRYQAQRIGEVNHQKIRFNIGNHQAIRIRKNMGKFYQKTRIYWGEEAEISSRSRFVKYSNNFKSKATIDFRLGKITVETTQSKNPKKSLEKAIVATLLTPKDPSKVDLFSNKETIFYGEPFLYKEVLDNEGKPIRWPWRAKKYAKFLIKKSLKTKSITTKGGVRKKLWYVSFSMIGNKKSKKYKDVYVSNIAAKKYKPFVMQNSKKYNLNPSLIYAIIETESHFNPYAVSPIPAFGLMQVVPYTAGADAFKLLRKKEKFPSKNYLFVPKNNIQIGSIYLHILDTRYLNKIKNPISREYCIIAAYNTGSGNVLKTFSGNRKYAFKVINRLSPTQVYNRLKTSLPYDETRRYVVKVTKAKERYKAI